MDAASRRASRFAIATLICILLVGAVTVSAQSTPTPITIGQNQSGILTVASGSVPYSLAVTTPQSVTILTLAVTPGFAPTFRVIDPGGVVVFDSANPGTGAIAQGVTNLASPGTYTLEVRSANHSAGHFLISVQAGAPLAPPQALTPGTPVSGSVNGQTTRQAYSFSGSSTDVLLLTVRSDDPSGGANIVLRDADSDETLGLSGASLGGVSYRILIGQRNYLLEVTSSGASTAQAFSVCLATESGSVTCPGGTAGTTVVEATITPTLIAGVPTQTPTFAPAAINPTGACEVAPARNNSVNIRSGAGTSFNIVGQIAPSATALVVGRLADNSWYQVNVNGVIGWVSATVVIPGGNCAGVAVVVPPAPPAAAPTAIMPTTVLLPSSSLDSPSINTPNPHPTVLDLGAAPINGEVTLDNNISPDPYTVNITAGGPVDVSYLGGECSGYASAAADFGVYFNGTPGGLLLLRFYFLANGGDALMIVEDPTGHITCNSDSPTSINPMVSFTNNQVRVGLYTIWLAYIFPNDGTRQGTLNITSNPGNHP